MPTEILSAPFLINSRTDYKIHGKYVLLSAQGGTISFSKFRNDARRDAYALLELLDRADKQEATGQSADGMETAQSLFDQRLEEWKSRTDGKDLAEKYPQAELIMSMPHIDIARDTAYITSTRATGIHTSALDLGLYAQYHALAGNKITEYRTRGRAKVVAFPKGS